MQHDLRDMSGTHEFVANFERGGQNANQQSPNDSEYRGRDVRNDWPVHEAIG